MKVSEIVYDLEIIRAIPSMPPKPGVEYCQGWHDHANMGISVLCAYDCANHVPMVFCADNLSDFQSLIDRCECAIGFNNRKFDNEVLFANQITVPPEKTYDLLREIWLANGLDPEHFQPRTHGGYGLDAMAYANFERSKTGNGALAPEQWQRGEIGRVISYCLNDVMLTYQLWMQVKDKGTLIDPKTNRLLRLRSPSGKEIKECSIANL